MDSSYGSRIHFLVTALVETVLSNASDFGTLMRRGADAKSARSLCCPRHVRPQDSLPTASCNGTTMSQTDSEKSLGIFSAFHGVSGWYNQLLGLTKKSGTADEQTAHSVRRQDDVRRGGCTDAWRCLRAWTCTAGVRLQSAAQAGKLTG